jgi:hypothetical protein
MAMQCVGGCFERATRCMLSAALDPKSAKTTLAVMRVLLPKCGVLCHEAPLSPSVSSSPV